jgi:hypothetical protein
MTHELPSPEHVIITARDIYTVTLSTSGKVDALVSGMHALSSQQSDHEARLRKMEARFFGVVGTFGLSAFALIIWILEAGHPNNG